MTLTCFKSYDIRGRLGTELNEVIAYDIGRAYARIINPKTVVIGGDARATSESLKLALSQGLQAEGVDTIDIGLVGTEEIYFAVPHLNADGGIMVTASHNPIDYNGMKLVREQSIPLSGDTELLAIKSLAETKPWNDETTEDACLGSYQVQSILAPYVQHLLSYIDLSKLKPLKLVVNSGNGAAGHVIDALEVEFEKLNVPIEFVKVFHEPDETFPNGIPNPILIENRQVTTDAVLTHKADFGIAWDGDFDRCFLFDETGQFIEGYYIVGLLAEMFLRKNSDEKIIHDPRLTWNTQEIVHGAGGQPIMSQTGHAFIKERMRAENAIYGGEMSAHHYFRDFHYCDSGMIPWLLVIELISVSGKSLSQLVSERILLYPSSGEINLKTSDPELAKRSVLAEYGSQAIEVDNTDGISMTFDDSGKQWRFNLRCSNTEPLLRLNIESKADKKLMQEKTRELLNFLARFSTNKEV
ncbi:phosphomannomutase CpsG [Parashewanella curva]|uniref:phosphomannomutase n=1 Tax=Parashewanella curva TaxID=2338552 RepID=A0A3L8Q258_9GAMM|nr:phosphomannomutase CpsG [Parashewanella curva]RLV61079.1 phosphomannomutase CpsG [Parashewanella curva]